MQSYLYFMTSKVRNRPWGWFTTLALASWQRELCIGWLVLWLSVGVTFYGTEYSFWVTHSEYIMCGFRAVNSFWCVCVEINFSRTQCDCGFLEMVYVVVMHFFIENCVQENYLHMVYILHMMYVMFQGWL